MFKNSAQVFHLPVHLVYFMFMRHFSIGPVSFSLHGELSEKILSPLVQWPHITTEITWSILFKNEPVPQECVNHITERGDVWYYENDTHHGFLLSLLFCKVFQKEKEIHVWPLDQANLPLVICEIVKHAASLGALEIGGFLFHSSALYRNQIGSVVFFGGSGAGKSTIHSLLSQTWHPLHDEINLIYKKNGEYYVATTPLSNTGIFLSNTPDSAPIKKCFLIKKGLLNKIAPISTSRAFQALTTEVIFQPSTNLLCMQLLDNAANFLKEHPIDQLTFIKDDSFSTWFDAHYTGDV